MHDFSQWINDWAQYEPTVHDPGYDWLYSDWIFLPPAMFIAVSLICLLSGAWLREKEWWKKNGDVVGYAAVLTVAAGVFLIGTICIGMAATSHKAPDPGTFTQQVERSFNVTDMRCQSDCNTDAIASRDALTRAAIGVRMPDPTAATWADAQGNRYAGWIITDGDKAGLYVQGSDGRLTPFDQEAAAPSISVANQPVK